MDKAERQLQWVQKNRARGRRPVRFGDVARAVVSDPRLGGPTWRRRLLSVLAEYAGAELLDHVRLAGLREGVLRIEVADPAVLYHLRVRWEQRIIEVLQAELPAAGVHSVRFCLRGHEH